MKLVVIIPTHCQELHAEGDPSCWCRPKLEKHGPGYLLIHNNPVGGFGPDANGRPGRSPCCSAKCMDEYKNILL